MPPTPLPATAVAGYHASSGLPAITRLYDVSVAAQSIGNVEIDCCLKKSECVRGNVTQGPGVAVYFDISMVQPGGHVLEFANVALTFATRQGTEIHVTDHFGPKALRVETSEQTFNRVLQLAPNIGATFPGGSANFSGVGPTITTDYQRNWLWEFYGSRKADEQHRYRTIRWTWDGTRLGNQDGIPRGALRCGVIVLCDLSVPFEVRAEIDGKLKGFRGLRYFFKSSSKRIDKFPIVSPGIFHASPPDLEILKSTIHDDMLRAN
jgi:hypothetical protein